MNKQNKHLLHKRGQARERHTNLKTVLFLNADVDIYWPEYRRYIRGTLVKQAPVNLFEFFIRYEDDDYQQTDLNAVRWHFAKGSYDSKIGCCKRDQERLHGSDFLPGDLLKCIQHLPVVASADNETTATSGKIEKKGRVNPERKVRTRSTHKAEGHCVRLEEVSDRTICSGVPPQPISERSSEQVTTLELSLRSLHGAVFEEDGKENDTILTQESNRDIFESRKFSATPEIPAARHLHPKAHCKKLLLHAYTSSVSPIQDT